MKISACTAVVVQHDIKLSADVAAEVDDIVRLLRERGYTVLAWETMGKEVADEG